MHVFLYLWGIKMSLNYQDMSELELEYWRQVDEMFLLESSYAQRWLTLFLQAGLKRVTMVTIEQIRDLMLVSEEDYTQKSDLIKRVVYGPIDEINLSTFYEVKFTYLLGKRKPILGFNFILYEKIKKKTIMEFVGSTHFTDLCKQYGIPSSSMLAATRYPLITAALFQANRDIKTGKTRIVISQRNYMLKVIENSYEYLQPIINFK